MKNELRALKRILYDMGLLTLVRWLLQRAFKFELLFGLGSELKRVPPQCCHFIKSTHIDKNTDLIRTYFLFKYRPNTDPILAHLKKNTDLAGVGIGASLQAVSVWPQLHKLGILFVFM